MKDGIQILFQKYLAGDASKEELKMLRDYFAAGDDKELEILIRDHLNAADNYVDLSETKIANKVVNERWATIAAKTSANEKKKFPWLRWATIAALLIGLLLGAMYYLTRPEPDSPKVTSVFGSDVLAPNESRATLLLADGTQIELDSSSNGIEIKDKAIFYSNGKVVSNNQAISTAILKVPNGGIYRLTLSDGTKVVLNAGSSLSYPLQFSDSIRSVSLDGEGYFEVRPDKTKPFKVQSLGQTLTVLGTHFNIQSYAGEPTVTTLLEGKVSLNATRANTKTILAPHQQATMLGSKYHLKRVNATEAIAWAENLFVFNDSPLGQIFKDLERWYDIEITYPKSMADEKFMIEIAKDRRLSEVLSVISGPMNLNFKIEGRRVTAIKK